MIFNLAKKANDDGEYFPIWGTGLGFECLVELIEPTIKKDIVSVMNKSK